MKKVTIRDIAEELNLSKSTVALALSDGYGVNEETRSKVLLKAYELGYKSKAVKDSPFTEVKKITMVLSCSDMISASFWSEIINGIEVTSINKQINLSIVVFRKSDDITVLLEGLNSSKTQGIIIVNECDDDIVKKILKTQIPAILVDPSSYHGMELTQVRASNFYGSSELTKYLINCGFKSIAFWGSLEFADSFVQRYNGAKSTVNGNKDISFVRLTDSSLDTNFPFANRRVLKDYFAKNDRPNALICANDMLVTQAIDVLKCLNLKVPDDVSVVGFDNLDSNIMSPQITTVAIKKFEIGRIAVEELINIILSKQNYATRLIEVGTYLVYGKTVKIKNN